MPKIAEATRSARREQILTAALTCFARTGYNATTMGDVAAQAGLSKGTPYLYFAGKEDLYVALHDAWDCALADRVDAEIAQLSDAERGSPRRVLRAVVAAVGAHVVDQAQTCRVLMEARTLAGYHPTIAAAVRAADVRAREPLQQLIRAGITAGQWLPDTDPGLQARLILATLHGLMAQWHLAPGSFSWTEAATAIAADPSTP
jgi:AcrR family transcriptional regulator